MQAFPESGTGGDFWFVIVIFVFVAAMSGRADAGLGCRFMYWRFFGPAL
jgi:hypothetical protein